MVLMGDSEGSELSQSSSSDEDGGGIHPLDSYLEARDPKKKSQVRAPCPDHVVEEEHLKEEEPSSAAPNEDSLSLDGGDESEEDEDEGEVHDDIEDEIIAAVAVDRIPCLESSEEEDSESIDDGEEEGEVPDHNNPTRDRNEDSPPPNALCADYFPEELPDPVGVAVLEPGTARKQHNAEMARLLRQPRHVY